MIDAPCLKCERKGCGPYHDQCPEFIEFKKAVKEERKKKDADAKMNAPYRKYLPKPMPNAITRTHKYRRDDYE